VQQIERGLTIKGEREYEAETLLKEAISSQNRYFGIT
jgi:hypothetical protein